MAVLLFTACAQKDVNTAGEQVNNNPPTTQVNNTNTQSSSVQLNKLFSEADAENILGEPAHVTDSTQGSQQGITAYRSAYTADAQSSRVGAIYFLVEEYSRIPDAQTKYSFIKASNENSAGFKVLEDLGDEAYFHSDNENFYFFMVRKGNRVANLKVNKITPKTSLDDFNRVSHELANKL